MIFKLIFFVIFIVIQNFKGIVDAAQSNSQCNSTKVDNCMLEMVFIGDQKFPMPVNEEMAIQRCKRNKVLEKCVKDYSSKCLTDQAGQAVSVLIYGITKGNKNFCNNKKRKELLAEMGRCVNQDLKRFTSYMSDLTRTFHGIKEYKDPKLRIPLMCW